MKKFAILPTYNMKQTAHNICRLAFEAQDKIDAYNKANRFLNRHFVSLGNYEVVEAPNTVQPINDLDLLTVNVQCEIEHVSHRLINDVELLTIGRSYFIRKEQDYKRLASFWEFKDLLDKTEGKPKVEQKNILEGYLTTH